MQFLMVTTGDANVQPALPTPEVYAEMGRFVEELSKSGVLVATGGLDSQPTTIKSLGGKVTVTDGPFTEAKEAIVSFAVVNANSKEEAIEYSKRFWKIVGDGEGKIYQVFGPDSGAPAS